MPTVPMTVSLESADRNRLASLAHRTGRSAALLAAEAISEYLDVNEWQAAGIAKALESADRGEGVPHQAVKNWVSSWNDADSRP